MNMTLPRPYPVTRFHINAALPGFVVVLAITAEVCAIAMWMAQVLR